MSEITSAIGSAITGAATGGLSTILSAALSIIDKVIPDPAAKAQAQLALLQLQQSGQLAEIQAQLQVQLAQSQTNTTEASSVNWFEADWRPFVGWICGLGLLYSFLLRPLIGWLSPIWSLPSPPALDLENLMTLLFGMLGLGALKMNEAIKTQ